MAKLDELPYCDLIMKGGITSGVIYPRLMSRLAEEYRFKNIGGTSAGAIAAAGCAAAEYGRQHENPDAFARLDALPGELSDNASGKQESRLFHFFQPAQSLSRHFQVLTAMLNQENRKIATLKVLMGMLRIFWKPALVGAMAFLILLTPLFMIASGYGLPGAFFAALLLGGVCVGWLWIAATRLQLTSTMGSAAYSVLLPLAALVWLYAWLFTGATFFTALGVTLVTLIVLPACLILALSTTTLMFGKSLLDGMATNFYGICSGHQEQWDREPQALTDWLAQYFDQLAGLSKDSMPLTFGHLWGNPPPTLTDIASIPAREQDLQRSQRALNLEVMTTAVSQNMAYSIPFRDGVDFYYDPIEWRALFPDAVMNWLDKVADEIEDKKNRQTIQQGGAPRQPVTVEGKQLKKLPPNRYLPVVVAVRMSLSFPVLLSAIPLYARDYSQEQVKPIKRVWFSDGGICSNIPLHMFDAPLPHHPTFAVNLKEMQEDNPRVFLPATPASGHERFWDDTAKGPFGLFNLLWEMVNTMQNWRDEIQFPYPGYRDRIVQISQRDNEGGLNLNMPQQQIIDLSDAGREAAERLIDRFHPTRGGGKGWQEHQETRLRTFMGLLEEMMSNPTLVSPHWKRVAQTCGKYSPAEMRLVRTLLVRLRQMRADIGKAKATTRTSNTSLINNAPKPRPTLRIVPKI